MYLERYTRVRFFLAFWLFVLSGVAFLDRTNISIAGLQIGKAYGLSNQRLGWIFSAFLIGYAGFQIPAGWLAARFGPRRVLTLGVLWWGVATALTALASHWLLARGRDADRDPLRTRCRRGCYLSCGQPVCCLLDSGCASAALSTA